MSDELYEALERFSVMSLQSDVGDEKAFEYIEKHYGKEIVEELKRIVQ